MNEVHAGLARDQTWSLARPACISFTTARIHSTCDKVYDTSFIYTSITRFEHFYKLYATVYNAYNLDTKITWLSNSMWIAKIHFHNTLLPTVSGEHDHDALKERKNMLKTE